MDGLCVLSGHKPLHAMGQLSCDGAVILCMTPEGQQYCLKCINRIEQDLRNVVREVEILKHLSASSHAAASSLFMTADSIYVCSFTTRNEERQPVVHKSVFIQMPLQGICLWDALNKHQQRFQQQGLGENATRWLSAQVLLGLRSLHQQGIIHRDLSDRNILIDNEVFPPLACICDFGRGRKEDEGNVDSIKTPCVTTPYSAAPEVLFCSRKYNSSADIWALGTLIGVMLTGQPLFQHKHREVIGHLVSNIASLLGTPLAEDYSYITGNNQDGEEVKGSEATTPGVPDEEKKATRGLDDGMEKFLNFLKKSTFPKVPCVVWPKFKGLGLSAECTSFLDSIFVYNFSKRPTAEQALAHPWFQKDDHCWEYIQSMISLQDDDGPQIKFCGKADDIVNMKHHQSSLSAAVPRSSRKDEKEELKDHEKLMALLMALCDEPHPLDFYDVAMRFDGPQFSLISSTEREMKK